LEYVVKKKLSTAGPSLAQIGQILGGFIAVAILPSSTCLAGPGQRQERFRCALRIPHELALIIEHELRPLPAALRVFRQEQRLNLKAHDDIADDRGPPGDVPIQTLNIAGSWKDFQIA
jgi:hypothetical protein